MIFSWLFDSPLILYSITGIKFDFFEFIYDIALTAVSSFIVWKITTRADGDREIRRLFARDRQELLDYIELLRKALSSACENRGTDSLNLVICPPYRESFDYLPDTENVMGHLSVLIRDSEQELASVCPDKQRLIGLRSDLLIIKNAVARLELPSGHLRSFRSQHIEMQIKNAL